MNPLFFGTDYIERSVTANVEMMFEVHNTRLFPEYLKVLLFNLPWFDDNPLHSGTR